MKNDYYKYFTYKDSLKAVKQDGYALKYVKNQTEDICLEAVKQNKMNLLKMKNKTDIFVMMSFVFMCIFLILTWTDHKIIHMIKENIKVMWNILFDGSILSIIRLGCLVICIISYICVIKGDTQ